MNCFLHDDSRDCMDWLPAAVPGPAGRRLAACLALTVLACLCLAAWSAEPRLRCRWPSPNGRVPLDMTFDGEPMIIIPPGENLLVSCADDEPGGRITVIKDGQAVQSDAVINFTAPEKAGAYFILLDVLAGNQRREVEICVLVPHKATARKHPEGLELRADGQKIGLYRLPALSGNPKVRENPDSYQPPVWWLRITEMNAGFEVVPGLTVGELVAPSEDTGRRHTDLVPVNYPMWSAILILRNALEDAGIPGRALTLISMYRSPEHNRRIGSNAYGRHIYGDAFDFYIDLDGSGKAADLNRDGRRDRFDAYPIVALMENLQADGKLPMGGIGVYNTVGGDHEVTMHLDARGHRATWGYLISAGGRKSEFSWQSKRFAELDRQDEERAAARAAREGKQYTPPHAASLSPDPAVPATVAPTIQ